MEEQKIRAAERGGIRWASRFCAIVGPSLNPIPTPRGALHGESGAARLL